MLATDVSTKIWKLAPTWGHQYPNTRNITVDVEVGTITKLFSVEKSEDVKKPNPRIRECQRG